MGLKSDIKTAFLTSMGNPEDEGNIDGLAQDITDAIITFLTKQTFTITEMKAILEVEEIKTTGPLPADVLSTVTTNVNGGMTGAPGPVVNATGIVKKGSKGVLIPKINYNKKGGQGGVMMSMGHAYIGRNPVDGSETNEDLTKVKLLEDNIVGE
tara:strand:- start:1528 stop:1989 length:462 start_codon:yes stop_codon:yes gene_type:complete